MERGTLGNIVQVSLGYGHSCALNSDKKVLCWGRGADGGLGDKQTEDRHHPVFVLDGEASSDPMENVLQIDSGESHTCALMTSSEVRCWGAGGSGELGNGGTSNKSYPVSVLREEGLSYVLTNIVQVSLGANHSCALGLNGQVKCWGKGEYGRLGYNGEDNKSYPVSVMFAGNPLDGVVEVSSGGAHTCALSSKDQVNCWGRGEWGQLGNDETQDYFYPVVVVKSDGVSESLSVGTFQRGYTCSTGSCSLENIALSSGNVSIDSQSGTATLSVSISGISAGETVSLYSDLSCKTLEGGPVVSGSPSVSMGKLEEGNHKFYYKVSSSGGTISNCSRNFLSYVYDKTAPEAPGGPSIVGRSTSFSVRPVVAISNATPGDIIYFYKDRGCGSGHKVGEGRITKNSVEVELGEELTTLGNYEFYGKIVDDAGNESSCSTSFASYVLEDFVAPLEKLTMSRRHGCALRSGGEVKCWGEGANGKLGNDASNNQSYPVSVVNGDGSVTPLTDIIQVTSGDDYSCALTSQGEVKCWGAADKNKLGDGSSSGHKDYPVSVLDGGSNLGGVVQISSGHHHTCALTREGNVKCWGDSVNGRLGNISSLTGIVQVSSGGAHSCALTEEGKVKCWGYGAKGRLGNRSIVDSSDPVWVQNETEGILRGVVQLSTGLDHSCALLENFIIKCWGNNDQGQLGVNDITPSERHFAGGITNPQSLGSAVSVKAGRAFTCALLSDGKVKCWGENNKKELGRLTQSSSNNLPEFVVSESGEGNLGGIVQIVLGSLDDNSDKSSSVCALHSTGGVRCWGDGAYGKLLSGASSESAVPIVALGSASTRFNVGAWRGEYRCSSVGCAISDLGLTLESPTTSPSTIAAPRIGVSGISSGETITLYKESSCSTSWGTAGLGDASVTVDPPLNTSGRYDFYFKSSVVGTSCSRGSLSYLFDITPPDRPGISVTTEDGTDDTPTVSVTSVVAWDTIKVYVDDVTCGDAQSLVGSATARGNSINIDVSPLSSAGTYRFYAIAEDDAGNRSLCSSASDAYTYSSSF